MLSLARRRGGIFRLVLNIPNVTAIDSRSHKPGGARRKWMLVSDDTQLRYGRSDFTNYGWRRPS